MEAKSIAKQFLSKHNDIEVEFYKEWDGYSVFIISETKDEINATTEESLYDDTDDDSEDSQMPAFVLVKDNEAELAQFDAILAILGFPPLLIAHK